ncbi:MAG: hypothetical protein WBW55_03710 [Desulfobaccales bacterium]
MGKHIGQFVTDAVSDFGVRDANATAPVVGKGLAFDAGEFFYLPVGEKFEWVQVGRESGLVLRSGHKKPP